MAEGQPAYEYADYDGAYFRREAGAFGGPFNEVWKKTSKQWGPYLGSGTKIALHGDAIPASYLPAGAAEPADAGHGAP